MFKISKSGKWSWTMQMITLEHVMLGLSSLIISPYLQRSVTRAKIFCMHTNFILDPYQKSKHLDFTTFKCLSIKNGHDHEYGCRYLPMLQMIFNVLIAATHHAAIQITYWDFPLSYSESICTIWRMIHRIFWIKCINAWDEDTYHTQKRTFDVLETRNLAAYASSPPSSHLKSWTDNQITFYELQPGFNILLNTFFLWLSHSHFINCHHQKCHSGFASVEWDRRRRLTLHTSPH